MHYKHIMTKMTHLEESCYIRVSTLIIGTRFTFLCLSHSSGFWLTWLASVIVIVLNIFLPSSHGIYTYSSMKHNVTLPKVSVVAAYLSQDQYQKKVESMTRPRTWKVFAVGLTFVVSVNGLVDFDSKRQDWFDTSSPNSVSHCHECECVHMLCTTTCTMFGSSAHWYH